MNQYRNCPDRYCNLEHRYTGRQSLVNMKVALRVPLKFLCFFLNLFFFGIVLRDFCLVSIGRGLPKGRQNIYLGRRLRLLNAFGFEIAPLIGRLNLL